MNLNAFGRIGLGLLLLIIGFCVLSIAHSIPAAEIDDSSNLGFVFLLILGYILLMIGVRKDE